MMTAEDSANGTYFPMRQFVRDQWKMNSGLPITLVKVVTTGGKRDSSYVSGAQVGLGAIMEQFVKTDIGGVELMGRYQVSVIEDEANQTRTFYYEAKFPELYTQKLQVITSPDNGKIKSLFVEAGGNNRKEKPVKLYYVVDRLIQIQEEPGSREEKKTEYFFPIPEGA